MSKRDTNVCVRICVWRRQQRAALVAAVCSVCVREREEERDPEQRAASVKAVTCILSSVCAREREREEEREPVLSHLSLSHTH